MEENIHIKISANDKQEIAQRARALRISLSGYIRLKLKESTIAKEVALREIVS